MLNAFDLEEFKDQNLIIIIMKPTIISRAVKNGELHPSPCKYPFQ